MPDLFDGYRVDALPPAPAPLRREGDRRRRRTRVIVAGAATALVLAVAAPLALRLGGDDLSGPDPAGPDPTTHGSGPSVGESLPQVGDFVEYGETSSPWKTSSSSEIVQLLGDPCGVTLPVDRPGAVATINQTYADDEYGQHVGAAASATQFETAGQARTAYTSIAQAYADCSAALTSAGETNVSETETTDVELGDAASAGRAARTFFTTYDAPPDDHAMMELQNSVALDGDRVLLVSIPREGQDYWTDLADSMPSILNRFLGETAVPDAVLYDYQLGYVRLGESAKELAAAGVDQSIACVEKGKGVTAIHLPAKTATTSGLRAGDPVSRIAEAKDPTVTEDVEQPAPTENADGSWTVETPTGDGSAYHVAVEGDVIASITLRAKDSTCG
ncbi:MAG: hypothetical protein QM572_11490 [Nocardioides sp.]|uniref:hypothetical protein n=1 Tax=Nocardioides sp. TaxID=35761 RepID=UPI0039E65F00